MIGKLINEFKAYKMYKSNKEEVDRYLFETSFGSECDICLDFTTLHEKKHFDGVCEGCFKSGTQTCARCGSTVYTTDIDVDMVCSNCRFEDDFAEYYDSDNFYPNALYNLLPNYMDEI